MSWLTGGTATLDEVYGLTPVVHEHYCELERDVWTSGVDPVLLELVRLRIAKLLGSTHELAARTPAATAAGLDEAKIAELAQWPTSPRYTARERMVLSFCESYVIDAHSVTDAQCARLQEQYAPQDLAALTIAIAVFDAKARLRCALDV